MSNYPGTIGFPSDGESIEATADKIEASSAAEIKPRPTSGLERGTEPTRYDPATFIAKAGPAPATLPATRGSSSSSQYVMADGLSALHHKVRDALRREDDATLGETKQAAKAWVKVEALADEAEQLVRAIPFVMRDARVARSEALAAAGDEPVVLPSEADARAHAERRAAEACRAALAARAAYDQAVADTASERLAGLQKAIPVEAAEVVGRVADLRSTVERLRQGVATLADAAGEEPGRMSAQMPTAVKLEVLDKLEAEVAALAAVAEEPSEPAIRPRLPQRAAIARRARQAVSGLTPEVLELARVERREGFKQTDWTRSIPDYVLANFAEQMQAGGGSAIW